MVDWTFSSSLRKYLVAVVLVGAAVCCNLLLTKFVEPSSAPLLFAAVVLASLQGWGPGLVATLLAGLADDYFFIAPIRSIDLNLPVLIRLAVFLSTSSLTSYLTASLRHAIEQRDRLLIQEREARAVAENANTTKDRFLAVTSHELRAPLAGITLWAEVLGQLELPADIREGVDAIQQCAQTQKRLIDDLVDVARLRTGKLRLDFEPVDLVGTIHQTISTSRPLVAAKQIDLSLSLDENLEATIRADRVRLQQVVTNLLGNAIKFTPEGGKINVSLERFDSTAALRITDSGRGIEPQNLSLVFDRFWQGGGNTNKTAGDGLGLGLAIVRDLIKLHGGQIRAESQGKGCGATFTVELPILPASIPDEIETTVSVTT